VGTDVRKISKILKDSLHCYPKRLNIVSFDTVKVILKLSIFEARIIYEIGGDEVFFKAEFPLLCYKIANLRLVQVFDCL